METHHIKAVIFDCYGVLATDSWIKFRKKHFANNPILMQKAMDMNKDIDLGKMGFDDFIAELSKMTGLSTEDTYNQVRHNIPNTKLFEFIKENLKPHFKIGFLSNASENRLNELFSERQVALFDGVVLSCDIGYVKPQSQAYLAIAKLLGVNPQECILVDDQERSCDGAKLVGMQTILYKNLEDTKTALLRLIDQKIGGQ